LTYRGSTIHRVVPGFVMQGGDFIFGNGSGGESIYANGKKFKDEKAGLELKHDKKGILSMGNSGKNSNTSQFFITLDAAPQCDSKHVVFGEIVSGLEVISAVEQQQQQQQQQQAVSTHTTTTTNDKSNHNNNNYNNSAMVTVTDCGIFQPFVTPAAGYWYDQPDHQSYSGFSPVFMVRPRVLLLTPTDAVSQKFKNILRSTAVITSISMDKNHNDNDNQTDIPPVVDQIQSLLNQFSIDISSYATSNWRNDIFSRLVTYRAVLLTFYINKPYKWINTSVLEQFQK